MKLLRSAKFSMAMSVKSALTAITAQRVSFARIPQLINSFVTRKRVKYVRLSLMLLTCSVPPIQSAKFLRAP